MSDRQIIRAHSVTVNQYVRTKHSGGGNEQFVQEIADGRRKHEIYLDFGKRICTIVHIESGNKTQVPFEGCNSWNPYTEEEMLEVETKPEPKRKAG